MRQFDNIREVLFADQIVEDRSGNQRQPLFIQRCAEFIGPGRQIAPRAQFNAFITGGRRFFQYLGPRRQIRVLGSSTPQLHGALAICMVMMPSFSDEEKT